MILCRGFCREHGEKVKMQNAKPGIGGRGATRHFPVLHFDFCILTFFSSVTLSLPPLRQVHVGCGKGRAVTLWSSALRQVRFGCGRRPRWAFREARRAVFSGFMERHRGRFLQRSSLRFRQLVSLPRLPALPPVPPWVDRRRMLKFRAAVVGMHDGMGTGWARQPPSPPPSPGGRGGRSMSHPHAVSLPGCR
jgi:hypothetical protein